MRVSSVDHLACLWLFAFTGCDNFCQISKEVYFAVMSDEAKNVARWAEGETVYPAAAWELHKVLSTRIDLSEGAVARVINSILESGGNANCSVKGTRSDDATRKRIKPCRGDRCTMNRLFLERVGHPEVLSLRVSADEYEA